MGGERVRMVHLSSAEGARFAEICTETTEALKALGPSPLGRKPDGVTGSTGGESGTRKAAEEGNTEAPAAP